MPSTETEDILYNIINYEYFYEQFMSKNLNVPIITKLVVAGDPELKRKAKKIYSIPSHIEELNMRIDEIESAIGQDTKGPIGRAFAIRAEESCDKDSDSSIGHLIPKKALP